MRKNKITMNCGNFKKHTVLMPDCCYSCGMRDGYPQNLGGDTGCKNFTTEAKLLGPVEATVAFGDAVSSLQTTCPEVFQELVDRGLITLTKKEIA
jgi:hypothetical protein